MEKTVIGTLSFSKSLKIIIGFVRSGYLSSSNFGVPNSWRFLFKWLRFLIDLICDQEVL